MILINVIINMFWSEIMKIFCERLKFLREENELSVTELAKQLKVSHSTIIRWESGGQVSNIDYLYLIATYFNVSTDYLVGLEDD